MATLSDLAAEILLRVPNAPTNFDNAVRENAAAEAVNFYGSHFSASLVEDIAGSGVFDLTLPGTFDTDCSIITAVEYPAGERDPQILQSDTYTIYNNGSTEVLRLLCDTPQTGETVRLSFDTPYAVATLLAKDEYPVINLACSYYCDWIAAAYSTSTRSTIGADSAEHLQQERSFHDSAKRFRDLAFEAMGFDSTAGQEGRIRGSGSNGSGSGSSGGPSAPNSEIMSWYPTSADKAHQLTHR